MILYLTFNDAPSGIYSSQVIDVVKFQRTELNVKIKLIAFISLRGFFLNRKKIREELADAIVAPMFPGIKRWKYNSFSLKIICAALKPKLIIGRSVLATQLAFKTHVNKVVYDGRGAIAAEWREYGVITDPGMLSEIDLLEKEVIQNSDYCIAVSNQLLAYWKEHYNYKSTQYAIIPCTINKVFENINPEAGSIIEMRSLLGFDQTNIIYVYSGSIAGWQSFDLLYNFVAPLLNSSLDTRLLFLSATDDNITRLQNEFPGKIFSKKVSPTEVPNYLVAADYGLLIREYSITNKVASPVKFAEYLACGLQIIISENLGDYSAFVTKNNCGFLYQQFNPGLAKTTSISERKNNRQLALDNFTKNKFTSMYKEISGL